MKWGRRSRKGLTGIETAIIVIAFVIAASVFAFAVLNMGLLSTSKAQETITSGLEQAESSMKITAVYAFNTDGDEICEGVAVLVQVSGLGSIDFDPAKIAVSYKNDRVAFAELYANSSDFVSSPSTYDLKTFISSSMGSSKCKVVVVQGDTDELLESGEVFAVCLNLGQIDSTNGPLAEYDEFTVEVAPPVGAKLTYTGKMPPTLEDVMVLSGS